MGKRVDLSELADEPAFNEERAPQFAARHPDKVPAEQVAPNPLNSRVINPDSRQFKELKASIEERGQIEDSTVATRDAFLKIYPEFKSQIGTCPYVQVTGGQRRAIVYALARPLGISVKDELATDRATWVAATAEENLKRAGYNAMEEADAVALVVKECGNNQSEAARRLTMSRGWVNQRAMLLRLDPEAQQLLRTHAIPVHEIRGTGLDCLPREEQLARVRAIVSARETDTVVSGATGTAETAANKPPVPRQPTSRAASAMRKLGRIPADRAEERAAVRRQLGEALRTELLSWEDRRAVAEELLRDAPTD
ncbi:plasmid partitioning protein [Actinoplanes sp. NBRC 101535]|uniref:ParB/RepB/Spo0J family partition protein n=1 Tax=Actinoplanes sp. NBRC 101535 TaxID=3032196 RepID=UPI0024A118B9|nr:plasmid partitioning protein [Actinoplanes sp. NBRC 101535]GLY08319.1 hypothetical protein Acsp01_86980 [Actinoplanes sp. NBRC 101535]